MPPEPLWISEADVVRVMDLRAAIDALEEGARLQAAGRAVAMGKTHVHWGDGDTLHAIGAVIHGGLFGTKTWGHTKAGATPLLILWNAEGQLEAVIEAFALGQMRTGGMSGLATNYLAAPGAATLAMIGAGKQAEAQVAAVAAVRPLELVRLFSRSAARREAFAATLAGYGFAVETRSTVEATVANCAIVTTATRARDPFLEAAMLAPGAHINAIGAITPEREELGIDVLERASLIAADDPSAALRLSREIGRLDRPSDRLTPLHAVVAGSAVRPAAGGWTIFKAMGSGLADLSLGRHIVQAAREAGLGRPIPHPERTAPRLFSSRKEMTS